MQWKWNGSYLIKNLIYSRSDHIFVIMVQENFKISGLGDIFFFWQYEHVLIPPSLVAFLVALSDTSWTQTCKYFYMFREKFLDCYIVWWLVEVDKLKARLHNLQSLSWEFGPAVQLLFLPGLWCEIKRFLVAIFYEWYLNLLSIFCSFSVPWPCYVTDYSTVMLPLNSKVRLNLKLSW